MKSKQMKSVVRRTSPAKPSTVPLLHNGDRLTQAEFHRRYEAYPEDVKIELIGGIVYIETPLVKRRTSGPKPLTVPPLHTGDRLTQPEFHRRYEAYPEDVKFELIGGIVYMASPLREDHSDYDGETGFVLGLYRRATPGVKELHGATTILADESEPQPDLGLRILPEYGGQSRRNAKGYVEGAPDFLTEIAHSTVAVDMHLKKTDYKRAGVGEYLVICVEEQELHWFDFKNGGFILPDARGVYRSRVFPGLWIDGFALLACESKRVQKIARQGLKSPAHAAFVKRLQAAHRKHSSK